MAKGVGQPRALLCPQVAASLACGGCWVEREERGKGLGQAAGGKRAQAASGNALASCGHWNGVSRTRRLQTTHIYCLTVREATRLRLAQQGPAPSEDSASGCHGKPWCSLACSCGHSNLCLCPHVTSFLGVCVSSSCKDTSHRDQG